MKKFSLLLLLFYIFTFTSLTIAQVDPVVEKIIKIAKTDNQTMKHLDELCNRIGGRLIGSDNYDNAVDWATKRFKEWGLKVVYDDAGEMPVGFNRGPWFGKLRGPISMDLHFATPSYTSGTKGLQYGHVVIEPKSRQEFERMKKTIKGAWVLIGGKSTGWPIDINPATDEERKKIIAENDETEKQNLQTRRENFSIKDPDQRKPLLPLKEYPGLFYRELVEAGALGIIQAAPVPITALYDRKNIDNGYLTFENLPQIPDIKLNENQYKIIYDMVKERRRVDLEFDIRNNFKIGPVKYRSVIGVIEGTEFPNEYVMMGGHLDAFDVGTGGVDDGSGVTPAMEAARLIMKAGGKPKRTILVCLWAGEEFGLLGAKSWVKNNKEKLPNIVNLFNRDGGPTVPVSINVTEENWTEMEKVCAPVNNIHPDFSFKMVKHTPRKKPAAPGGTDASVFAMEGVPTMDFSTADPKGYDFNYGEIWHTERDLYNKSIPEYQEQTAVVTAVVVYGIANLKKPLSRKGYYTE